MAQQLPLRYVPQRTAGRDSNEHTNMCVHSGATHGGEEGKVTHVHQQMDGQANCVSQRTEISAPRDEAPREAT